MVGNTIKTTSAEWVVMDMYERKNDYIIKVRLANSKKPNKVQNFWITFKLLRYNEFDSTKNEWRMYNDQSGTYVTFNKEGIRYDTFVMILNGVLETFSY